MRHLARTLLDRYVPTLAAAYRERREHLRGQAPLMPTPFGFALAGSESMAAGTFEADEVRTVLEALDASDVCIDVGANIGFYTCLAASRGRPAIAIEPLPSNLHLLCRNLLGNQFHHRVEVFPVGVGRQPDLLPLYGANTGASFVSNWAQTTNAMARIVPVNTLDALLQGRFPGRRLFIKMDVEGYEFAALEGARKTLVRDPRPSWLVEICLTENMPDGFNPRFADTFARFWEDGYEAYSCGTSVRLVERDDVRRWCETRATDRGTQNYLFKAPSAGPV
jgi:FkbM family methyltransferase